MNDEVVYALEIWEEYYYFNSKEEAEIFAAQNVKNEKVEWGK